MGPVMTTTGHATVRRLLAGALTGVLTAAVALGVAELAAAIIGPNSAPVIAVGDTAINLTPIPVKEFAIAPVRRIGYGLTSLLHRAGVKAGADQVLSTSTDGMTISTPLAAIMDGRPALIAVGMNGQPLPIAHGFPARMIVPGLYGYVSATKWLTKLTVTTFAAQKAYWTQRGYSAQAPIKTESRIDVPRPLSQVQAGRIAVAGVAWAPAKGIAKVEVNVDNGPWQQATLAAADGIHTWRQWMWAWDAKPGLHTLQVRATDNSGATQTSARAYPVPNGASGWDSVVVTVT